jgi:hypothetical protein
MGQVVGTTPYVNLDPRHMVQVLGSHVEMRLIDKGRPQKPSEGCNF